MIFVHSMQVLIWLFRCTYFSLSCCSDLGVGGWVSGNPNIVQILKIRTQKWTFPYRQEFLFYQLGYFFYKTQFGYYYMVCTVYECAPLRQRSPILSRAP